MRLTKTFVFILAVLILAGCQAAASPAATGTVRPATTVVAATTPVAAVTAAPTSVPTAVRTPSPVATTAPIATLAATAASTLPTVLPAFTVLPTVAVQAIGTVVVGQLPEPVLGAVRAEVARQLGVDPTTVQVRRAERVDWPDSSLGCPRPGQAYAQVITPGYRLSVEAGGRTINVHTDMQGRAVQCL